MIEQRQSLQSRRVRACAFLVREFATFIVSPIVLHIFAGGAGVKL